MTRSKNPRKCLGYNLRHDSNIRQLASDSSSPPTRSPFPFPPFPSHILCFSVLRREPSTFSWDALSADTWFLHKVITEAFVSKVDRERDRPSKIPNSLIHLCHLRCTVSLWFFSKRVSPWRKLWRHSRNFLWCQDRSSHPPICTFNFLTFIKNRKISKAGNVQLRLIYKRSIWPRVAGSPWIVCMVETLTECIYEYTITKNF